MKDKHNQTSIVTVGYEGSHIDTFIETLKQNGIKVVIDVRDKPVAKKPSFSKAALSQTLVARGIAYVHLQGLGNPKIGRDLSKRGGLGWWNYYKKHLHTKAAHEDLQRAIAIAKKHRTALFCFERNARECHRLIAAKEIAAQTKQSIEHLLVPEQDK